MPGNQWRLVCLLAVGAALLGAYAMQHWGGQGVRGNTTAQRVESVERLASVRPAGAPATLAAATNDPDGAVRRAALAALGTYRRPEDREIFDRALLDADSAVRATAAQAVGGYGLDSVARLTAMAEDSDPRVRLGVVTGLCQTGRGPGLATLLAMMAKDADPQVRFQALKAIEGVTKLKYLEVPDPRDAAKWAVMVQRVRTNGWVKEVLQEERSKGVQP